MPSVHFEDDHDACMLLDFFFPRTSLTGDGSAWITDDELRQLRSSPVILEAAALRAQGLDAIDRITAAADYDSVPLLHRAVHLLKYKKVKGIGDVLGRVLAEAAVRMPGGVLCPVPLHWRRQFARGFNQAEVLAHAVGRSRGWPVQNLLRRTRWTGSQVGRHRTERLIGVKDAFALRSTLEIPSRVILVDDLSTTGATLNACATVLKSGGVKNVEGLVLAMG